MKFLLFFLSILCNAQISRFMYNLNYKRDSLANSYNRLTAVLETSETEASFYDYTSYKMDSVNLRSGVKNKLIPPLGLSVFRKKTTDTHINFAFISGFYIQFDSEGPIRWKLEDSIKIFDKYILQKAVAKFGGRSWIAWFSKEIPITEGPYKFQGLPGLIFEVYDDKKNFIFLVKNIYSVADRNTVWNQQSLFGMKTLKIDREKYDAMLLNEYNNLFQEFRNNNGDWTLATHGRTIKTVEGLNEIRRDEQKVIKKYYNPIEIDKAVKY